ncbi:hypothetical protein ABZ721_31560 [Streptomyces sp. NPDC006733]|uniref:hypothetical protein n=1 Tax=Streptomyces sp. NPDC006733 TaxID=3155460 RepID=UPI0033DA32E1
MLVFERLRDGDLGEVVRGLADRIEHRPDPPPSGPCIYTKNRSVDLLTQAGHGVAANFLTPTVIERWRRADGSGRLLRATWPDQVASSLVGTQETLTWGAGAAVTDRQVAAGEFTDPQEYWAGTLPFSCDPVQLSEQLSQARRGLEGPVQVLMAVRDLYHEEGVVKPPLRAAVLRALGARSDLSLLGVTVDASGREALAVGSGKSATSQCRLVLLFDPRDGELLGHEEVLVQDSARLGLAAPFLLSGGERLRWGRTRDTQQRM